jgi:hypothetical protein
MLNVCWDDSKASPAVKQGACYKLCPVGTGCGTSGGTIWVMDGTYKYTTTQKIGSSKNGTASNPFNIFAVAGAKPVFDFSAMAVSSTSRGIELGGNYWHLKGVTVTKAGDSGIHVTGNHITVEQCVVHDCQDTGILIGTMTSSGAVIPDSGSSNTILNCDSYHNNDTGTNGANADGFGAKKPDSGAAGAGNVFSGCRAWDNADDGYDFFGWISPVTIENSWAISMSKTTDGSSSNGNGFKLGSSGMSAAHILKDLYATDNKYGSSPGDCGFTNNHNSASMTCTGSCAAWGNSTDVQSISGVSTTAPGSATAAKMIAAPRNPDGSLPAITSL